jgi:glucokinase
MSLPASRRKSPTKKVLAFDLGGTKVEVGVVSETGRILTAHREPVLFSLGKKAVLDQLTRLGRTIRAHHPDLQAVGVASAGPLDPKKGLLLDPTNFKGPEGPWGITPLARILARRFKLPVTLENDAAAALLAEHWKGGARGCDNAAILTLGTGLGTAFLCNGELVRAGRHLHTEAGHLILRAGDPTARCGCGALGCAEAYLSGNGFARWVAAKRAHSHAPRGGGKLQKKKPHPPLTAHELAERARAGDRRARAEFEEMGTLLGTLVHNVVVTFCPERILLTGSFAQASDLFLPAARRELNTLLAARRGGKTASPEWNPSIQLSPLSNHAGLLGGAYVAFRALQQ